VTMDASSILAVSIVPVGCFEIEASPACPAT